MYAIRSYYVTAGSAFTAGTGAKDTSSSIAAARAAGAGSSSTVTGMVTMIDGKSVYVEDDRAGIVLYFKSAPSDLALGDMITVTGDYTVYKGLVELQNVESYTKQSMPLTSTTIGAIISDEASFQSKRVSYNFV